MTASNDLKTPIPESLGLLLATSQATAESRLGQAIPAEIASVDSTGTIVVVKFLVEDPTKGFAHSGMLLPQVEMPVATDLYGIPPLQSGDKGYCIPSTVYLGGVSGLGGGTASWAKPANLSALVFHPIGNTNATERDDSLKYFLSGPTGVFIKDLSGVADVTIGPIFPEGPANTIRLRVLINAPDDATAHASGVPLYGVYHDNGAMRYNYTVG